MPGQLFDFEIKYLKYFKKLLFFQQNLTKIYAQKFYVFGDQILRFRGQKEQHEVKLSDDN